MIRGEKKKKRLKEESEKKVVGMWEGSAKSPARCREKMQKGKKGKLWVKTCFLGKGLSPSKLSTKALCGNTRKRGNEKPEGN